jgi:hypothetical protein
MQCILHVQSIFVLIIHPKHTIETIKHARVSAPNQHGAFTSVSSVDLIQSEHTASAADEEHIRFMVNSKRIAALNGMPAPVAVTLSHTEAADV